MTTLTTEVKKARLKASGHTYDDLAREAEVTWRMVKFWIDGQRTSAKIQAAWERLTSRRRRLRGAPAPVTG